MFNLRLNSVLTRRNLQTPLATFPQANANALSMALKQFDTLLASSLLSTSPRLNYVASTRIAAEIQHQALIKLSDAYARVFDAVMSDKEGYEFGVTRMRRTKEEVRTLFGIDQDP
jgi:hypothetical protein